MKEYKISDLLELMKKQEDIIYKLETDLEDKRHETEYLYNQVKLYDKCIEELRSDVSNYLSDWENDKNIIKQLHIENKLLKERLDCDGKNN